MFFVVPCGDDIGECGCLPSANEGRLALAIAGGIVGVVIIVACLEVVGFGEAIEGIGRIINCYRFALLLWRGNGCRVCESYRYEILDENRAYGIGVGNSYFPEYGSTIISKLIP